MFDQSLKKLIINLPFVFVQADGSLLKTILVKVALVIPLPV